MNKIQVLDLFSGIGGFSLGLERAGFETVAFCEIDKYCRLVLQKHWKDIKIYSDVRKITRQQYEQDGCKLPEVITGGFPCQPFSVAGRQKGTGDNRYLWPEMFRVIKEFKPRWIIAENVRGIINIQDGVVFETVCTDLESQGYETQTFIIPAAGVGAPHRRERVWIIAHRKESMVNSDNIRFKQHTKTKEETSRWRTSTSFTSTSDVENSRRTIRGQQSSRNKESIGSGTSQETQRSADSDSVARSSKREKIMADSTESRSFSKSVRNSKGMEKESQRKKERGNQFTIRTKTRSSNVADSSSIQSREPSESERWKDSSRGSIDSRGNKNKRTEVMADSKRVYVQGQQDRSRQEQSRRSGWWDIEPDVGRVADGVPGRIHRLKGLGNSIVPQIAEEIGKAILKVDLIDRDSKT